MGTDIHLGIEVQIPRWVWTGDDEQSYPWQTVNMVWKDDFWYPRHIDDSSDETAARHAYTLKPYTGRNYVLFSVLGNVRNGSGFAGVDTGDFIEPCVGAERGLPDDLDPRANENDFGDHSFGWITVEELLAYDWSKSIVKRGVIPEKIYLEGLWRTGGPDSWSGSISGRDIVTFEENNYEATKLSDTLPVDKQIHVKIEWYPTLADCVSMFLDRLNEINDLIPLPSDRIRLVYGFDS